MLASTVPTGRTARRLEWAHLPPALRTLIEHRIGSPVVEAISQRAGYTPGFASVLTTQAGTRHFVKAASTQAQRAFAGAYREEAARLGDLPPGVPAPRLVWLHDGEDWVALETAYVDARLPHRPWRAADLDATLDALEVVAERLTPAPAAMGLPTFAEEHAEFPALWDDVLSFEWPLPLLDAHGAEAAELAAGFAALTAGDTLVHDDVRDDNTLIRPDGTALLCDWNWPCRGAAWIDTVVLMIGPRGDGLDVDAVLASRRLTRDVAPAAVDAVLALFCGFFLRQSLMPAPHTSPHLREFQRWQGEVAWDWLCERRGWVAS